MKLLAKSNLCLLALTLLAACSAPQSPEVPENPYGIRAYSRDEVDSIVENHPYTLIFAWTEWCAGGRQHFVRDVLPYVSRKPDSIGLILLYCGSYDSLAAILREQPGTATNYLYASSRGGGDKITLNRWFDSMLDDYHGVNAVPMAVLCDNRRKILNRGKNGRSYTSVADCIRSLSDPYGPGRNDP